MTAADGSVDVQTDAVDFPQRFGAYLLLAPLAQGGMGEVYLAKHGDVVEKFCVVKTLRAHLTDNREYVSRFLDEARIVVQLSHKNVCHVFDVGSVNGRTYLAMEYIAGGDLRTLLDRLMASGQGLEPGLALHVVTEILEALDYAHRQVDPSSSMPLRLVHRDVSAQNVMVSFEGEVKLIDFGLAHSTQKIERTEPNVVLGKITYMPPEQLRGERLDARADIFAVGVLLYELLAGRRYYAGMTPYEIYARASEGYQPPEIASLHDELRAVLLPAIAASRDERFTTAHDFREAVVALRLKHGLRGDAPSMRALVERTHAPEILASRALLARFASVAGASREASFPASMREPTESAPTPLAGVPRTATETEPVARPAQSTSRRSLVGAGAALAALVVAATAIVALRGNGQPVRSHDHAPAAAPHDNAQPAATTAASATPPAPPQPAANQPPIVAVEAAPAPVTNAASSAPSDAKAKVAAHAKPAKAHVVVDKASVDKASVDKAGIAKANGDAPDIEKPTDVDKPHASASIATAATTTPTVTAPPATPTAEAPRLRTSQRVISRNELARALKEVENELVEHGHLASTTASGVTVPLAADLLGSLDLGPTQSVTLHPAAIYWFVVKAADAGSRRDAIAADLVRANSDGRLQ